MLHGETRHEPDRKTRRRLQLFVLALLVIRITLRYNDGEGDPQTSPDSICPASVGEATSIFIELLSRVEVLCARKVSTR